MSGRKRQRAESSDSEDTNETNVRRNVSARQRSHETPVCGTSQRGQAKRRLVGSRGRSHSPATDVTLHQVWKALSNVHQRMDKMEEMMAAKLDGLTEAVAEIKGQLVAEASTRHTPTSSQLIPKALSREVKRIHRSLEDEHKYRGNERFTSEHNSAVTSSVSRTVMDEEEYDSSLIRRACNRYFENIKRESKLTEDNKMEEDRRAKALNNRRHRLLNSRRSVARCILTDEEFKYLEGASACLMSDEETDSENGQTWKVYPPEWRATKLTDILNRCQCQLAKLQQKSSRMVHRRVASGVCSMRQPPRGIDKTYLK